ncbi:alpha/beta fold hydrolase [Brachybacterium sp. FME24]|uniref:alpha/beta fold hydrolase n=1 Tax=Brachybacterium sp. FME24 TaxID=2742605 RepID=UPI001868439C|nr:alpha/beta fold hydrolase [Brachybacterium sp. FME24]
MPLLESGDSSIYYETHGQGPALVLVHAISAGAGMWRAQIERFAVDHQVIVFDARGVGRSGSIRGWRKIRDRMSDDLARLLDHTGHRRAAVCGVSFGGVIAQHFAARHPDRVERLAIVDSYSDTRPLALGRALWLVSVYGGAVSNFLPPRVLARIMRQQYRRWPEAAEVLAGAVRSLRPLDAFKTRWAINLVNYLPALNRADYPVLGVVGDSSWPRSQTFMEELAAAVPRVQLVHVADSCDPTPLCRPEFFDEILAAFLEDGVLPAAW